MTEIVFLTAVVSSLCLVFYVCWLALILGVVRGMDTKSAEVRTSKFAVRGTGLAKASVAVMLVSGVYVVWTGSLDAISYATASVGFLIGAFACWQAATSLGLHFCPTETKWRDVKLKAYLQAFGLTLLIVALERGKTFFESLV
ncbi:MAG: hypothetical protein ABJN34_04140 [Litoreibacter sp.]|uniref:hypothetical protein n=1 Tax=Litoreibacter sp. TaxID=1969459 RepID=UPI003296EA48